MSEQRLDQRYLDNRAKDDASEYIPPLPTTNTQEAWQDFLDLLEDIDVSDCAHQSADSWDVVIYYHKALEICTGVWTSTLHEAESICEDCDGFEGAKGLYETAVMVAYWLVYNAVSESLYDQIEELKELAESQIENLESV